MFIDILNCCCSDWSIYLELHLRKDCSFKDFFKQIFIYLFIFIFACAGSLLCTQALCSCGAGA